MLIVTGASGFIGANIVAGLNARGTGNVLAVDDYASITPKGAMMADFRAARYVKDMTVMGCLDLLKLDEYLEKAVAPEQVKGILHMGACSDTMVTDRDYVMGINYEYTRRLFEWCARQGVPFVYASSAATYGDGAQGYDDECDPAILQPLNLYGESKQVFDLWALKQEKTPARWAGLKFFNVYGPMEGHKGRMASVVYHGFHQITETGCIKLFESHKQGVAHGGQKRDFVYVEDVVRTCLHFLNSDATQMSPNGLYNVGTGAARSFEELARATFLGMNKLPLIEFVPMPEVLRDKYQYFTQSTKAKRERAGVRWNFNTLEEGVGKYVKWLEINQGRPA
jgi:ADP-L-glycero-D-manno-heptose 6-epimerase